MAFCRSCAIATMSVCHTSFANSLHMFGGIDVQGLNETCVRQRKLSPSAVNLRGPIGVAFSTQESESIACFCARVLHSHPIGDRHARAGGSS